MTSKRKRSKNPTWADVARQAKLSAEQVAMAQKCEMTPRVVRANHSSTRDEKWKAPVGEWIEHCYEKRFGPKAPKKTAPRRETIFESIPPPGDEDAPPEGDE